MRNVLVWGRERQISKHLTWFKVFVAVVVVIGIFFRFVNLDRKVYWHDETLTSLRTFGYTQTEFVDETFTGEPVAAAELQKFQHPNAENDLGDTLNALQGNAEHPPLYYLTSRLWAALFGSSVAAMRSLAAVIGVLVLPSTYWLCMELFGSELVGAIAVALVAVSPFHVLYSQEAREYSLWTVSILVSSAALLRSLRLQSASSWGLYAVTVALGLYSHLLALLVNTSHGLYVLLCRGVRSRKNFGAYLGATAGGFLLFSPWIIVVVSSLAKIHTTTSGSREDLSFSTLVDKWFLNFNRIFLDHELGAFNLLFVVLSLYALYFLCRRTPPRVWLFVLTLIGVTALTLVLPDVVTGGRRSTLMRYTTPCCLGIQMAIAYWLSTQFTAVKVWQQRFGRILLVLLVSMGIIGCTLSAQADVWWTKSRTRSGHYEAVATILNQAQNPILIADSEPINTLSFSRSLRPTVRLILTNEPASLPLPESTDEVYLLDPSEILLKRIRSDRNYRIKPVYREEDEVHLWNLMHRDRQRQSQ